MNPLPPATVAPPTITWPGPGAPPPDLAALVCPNCGSTAPKSFVLSIDVQLPDNPGRSLRVAGCPDCGARFYDGQTPPDYAEPGLNDRGRVPFYVQQGAGVSLITRPIAQVSRPPGTTYLEVGCGYGFGLDYAINTRGWRGRGIDPAPLAALGRDALLLPIELRYLRDDDEARGTIEVVLGSEVIEHVTSPAGFVRTLRAMLAPGGVLILTTPNGLDIRPETPPGVLIPLLSPCLHLTIQTPDSLRGLLSQAGFGHIEIEIDSHSLVAFASDAPIALEQDAATLRRALRSHLGTRGHALGANGPIDLVLGFAGRGYMEAVNDGALDEADALWPLLTAACQSQFSFDLNTIEALPDGVAALALEAMAHRVPLNLGGLVYAHSIRQLTAGMPRPALAARFRLAAAAAAAMRHALGGLAMEDGQTEDIGWTALAEAALCDAAGGTAAALLDLPGAPQPGRRRIMLARGFGMLASAGHHGAARALLADPDLHDAEADPLTPFKRDTLFFRAVLARQPDAPDAAAAADWFARVRAASAPGRDSDSDGLWWAALRGGAQALGEAGTDLLVEVEATRPGLDWPEDLAFQVTQALVERDAPGLAPRLVRLTSAQQAVVIGPLVNTGRLSLARTMLASGTMAAPTDLSDPAERDRLFFMAMVDAEIVDGRPAGDPARAVPRFGAVRAATEPGSGLWIAALRGELQALDLQGRQKDAAGRVREVTLAHPVVTLAPDILVRIGVKV